MQNVELLFETSSTSHLENPICWAAVRAAQPKHQTLAKNMSPNCSKSWFSLMCKILSEPAFFLMNFLEHLVCSTTCIWYRTRGTNNHRTRGTNSLSQNELVQLELCPEMPPNRINNFGPMLTHFARWLHKSRAKCRITLWDKLYESLGGSNLLSDSARSAAETPNFSPKYITKSLEIMIFAHVQNLERACIFSNEFSGAPRALHNLHMIQNPRHKQPQPKRMGAARVMPENATKSYK